MLNDSNKGMGKPPEAINTDNVREYCVDYFEELEQELVGYLEPAQIEKCRQAFQVAENAHMGQSRRSGEPYISHPVAAALILARMRLDHQTIMATLLHDVVEDTSVSKEDLHQLFGEEVTTLVDGVTKLSKIKFESRAEAQAEYFRKMVLAMVKDIRVIIVKLADRLHNMLTLSAMPLAKKKRIAIETLEIYAPIANRLGMHSLYTGLEDLGFKALYPIRYKILKAAVEKLWGNRRELTLTIERDLQKAMHSLNIPYEQVFGRRKHLYGIYRKMRLKKASFAEITDVFAFRVITEDIDSCYRILGALHRTYKPLPQRFKDYIGIPKANGYQSLHTILFGPFGVPLEVQIRTRDMDKVAENGVAAHWIYKVPGLEVNEAQLRAREWVQRLLDMQSSGTSLEFIENVKIDLFPDEIYVFTPKGHILELPKGATPVDFAYSVHSGIGNHCVAVKVNRRLVPLSMPLGNGQTVEIITSSTATPNPAWLNFVVTGKARSNIRHFLKEQQHIESVRLGKRLLEQSLGEHNNYTEIPPESLKALLDDLQYKSEDDLLFAIGTGNQNPMLISKRLLATRVEESPEKVNTKPDNPLLIKGTEGMVIEYATCCQPIPGDNIVGRFQQGKGIMVHSSDCLMIKKACSHPEQFIALCWDENVHGEFLVDITVDVENQRGVLASLATSIAESGSNISNINVDAHDGLHNAITFSISVQNRKHLARVMRRLRANKLVIRLYRKNTAGIK